jgi:hypothetical protein
MNILLSAILIDISSTQNLTLTVFGNTCRQQTPITPSPAFSQIEMDIKRTDYDDHWCEDENSMKAHNHQCDDQSTSVRS